MHATSNHPMKIEGTAKRVCPRQEGSVFVTNENFECRLNAEDVGKGVPIRKHDALWVTGCSGRVDERVERKRIVSDIDRCFAGTARSHKFRPLVNNHTFRRQFVCWFVTEKKHATLWPLCSIIGKISNQFVKDFSICYCDKRWF